MTVQQLINTLTNLPAEDKTKHVYGYCKICERPVLVTSVDASFTGSRIDLNLGEHKCTK